MSDVLERLLVTIEGASGHLASELRKSGVDVSTWARNTERQTGGVQNRFQELGRTMRASLAAVGISFTAQALGSWLRGALDVKNMTEAQLEATKEAREAMKSMRTASDELARSLADGLTPAMQGVSAVMLGWARITGNIDPTPFGKQIKDVEDALRDIDKHAIDTGIGTLLYSPEQTAQIENLNRQLDELIKKQRAALGLDDTVAAIRARLAARESPVAGMRRIDPNNIGSVYSRFGDVRGAFDGRTLRRPNVNLEELDELTGVPTGTPLLESADQFFAQRRALGLRSMAPVARQWGEVNARMKEYAELTEQARERQQRFADAIAASFEGRGMEALLSGKPRDAIRGFAQDLAELVIRITILQPLAEKLAKTLSNIGKGKGDEEGGGLGGVLGSLFGFAGGGRPPLGRASWVGERGPELFVPDVPGRIYSHAQSMHMAAAGGGVVIEQHFHNQIGLPPQWDAQVVMVGHAAAQKAYEAVMDTLGGRR